MNVVKVEEHHEGVLKNPMSGRTHMELGFVSVGSAMEKAINSYNVSAGENEKIKDLGCTAVRFSQKVGRATGIALAKSAKLQNAVGVYKMQEIKGRMTPAAFGIELGKMIDSLISLVPELEMTEGHWGAHEAIKNKLVNAKKHDKKNRTARASKSRRESRSDHRGNFDTEKAGRNPSTNEKDLSGKTKEMKRLSRKPRKSGVRVVQLKTGKEGKPRKSKKSSEKSSRSLVNPVVSDVGALESDENEEGEFEAQNHDVGDSDASGPGVDDCEPEELHENVSDTEGSEGKDKAEDDEIMSRISTTKVIPARKKSHAPKNKNLTARGKRRTDIADRAQKDETGISGSRKKPRKNPAKRFIAMPAQRSGKRFTNN